MFCCCCCCSRRRRRRRKGQREFIFPARRDQIQTERRRRRLRRNEHRTNEPSLEPARRRRPRPPPRFRDRPSEDLPPFYVMCVMCVRVRVSTSPRREVCARAICLSGEGFSSRARASFFFDRLQKSFLFVSLCARVLCVCVRARVRAREEKKEGLPRLSAYLSNAIRCCCARFLCGESRLSERERKTSVARYFQPAPITLYAYTLIVQKKN